MRTTLWIVALTLLAGCSNKSIYQGIQSSNQVECTMLPPSQYEECIERSDQPYDEYERERQEASER